LTSKTIVLERDKETKRTVRFREIDGGEEIGTPYIPKSTLAQLGEPQRITITLAAA
jgi:hypothetical protein